MKSPWQSQWKDYYEILQISQKAEPEIIVAAYKKLAGKYHPDRQGTGDEERMKLINEASEVLSDPATRRRYDAEYERRRSGASSKTNDEIDEAKARERRAQAEAAKARREAEEAVKKAQKEREELEEALREARRQPPNKVDDPRPSEPPAETGWLSILADVAKIALQTRASVVSQQKQPIFLQGAWQGSDGGSYHIRQNGDQVFIQGMNLFGIVTMRAEGTLAGSNLQLRFRLLDGAFGTASGEVSADEQQIRFMAVNLATGFRTNIVLYR